MALATMLDVDKRDVMGVDYPKINPGRISIGLRVGRVMQSFLA